MIHGRKQVVAGLALTAAVVAGIGTAVAGGHDATTDVVGPGTVTVHLGIEHSAFDLDAIEVRPGTTIRFVVDNGDPIGHELIVGDAALQRRHELGTEPSHPPRPGEVSVAALASAETTVRFDEPGAYQFACHLPGHYAYGMHGTITVTG